MVKSLIKPFNYLKASSNGCNNEHSSRHLLLASEPLKTQLFVKGIREIIRDLASPTEEVSIRLFYSSLQITFPNNVRVMRMNRREGRGEQSSLAFKGTCTKMGC